MLEKICIWILTFFLLWSPFILSLNHKDWNITFFRCIIIAKLTLFLEEILNHVETAQSYNVRSHQLWGSILNFDWRWKSLHWLKILTSLVEKQVLHFMEGYVEYSITHVFCVLNLCAFIVHDRKLLVYFWSLRLFDKIFSESSSCFVEY